MAAATATAEPQRGPAAPAAPFTLLPGRLHTAITTFLSPRSQASLEQAAAPPTPAPAPHAVHAISPTATALHAKGAEKPAAYQGFGRLTEREERLLVAMGGI